MVWSSVRLHRPPTRRGKLLGNERGEDVLRCAIALEDETTSRTRIAFVLIGVKNRAFAIPVIQVIT
jgi:hypothetical protein